MNLFTKNFLKLLINILNNVSNDNLESDLQILIENASKDDVADIAVDLESASASTENVVLDLERASEDNDEIGLHTNEGNLAITMLSANEDRLCREKQSMRLGNCNYVIKTIRSDLRENSYIQAIRDMAIEIQFLSVFDHPNIIKIKGISDHELLTHRCFVIFQRLNGTLEDKINEWKIERNQNVCCSAWLKLNRKTLNTFFLKRLSVACDISSVMQFIHEHK